MRLCLWCLFGTAFVALTLPAKGADPSVILTGGQVITLDGQSRIAEALAIEGDRIVAVGTTDEIRKLAGGATREIDLAGRTVMPGLIDSHVHPVSAALYEFDHPLPEFDTIGDVLAYISSRTKIVPEGEWITLSQVFITRLRDQRYPSRAELDMVAPKHPVLFGTGPDASLNSLALERAGITRETQITDGGPGLIEKDKETGEPTGILRSCTRLVKTKSTAKSATREEKVTRVKELFAAYNAAGITSVADRNASDDSISIYAELRDKGELTCRVFCSYAVDAQAPLEKIAERMQGASRGPHAKYDNQLWVRGIKVFLDGGMLTGSAYMKQPWGVSRIYSITDPEYRGLRFIPEDKLRAIVKLAFENNLQPTAHSVGDAAVQALVDAYVSLKDDFKLSEQRPCITHCNFMSPESIQLMKEHGIVADLQPIWLYMDGKTLRDQFGDERMTWFQPYKSIFESGVVVGGGSDHMQKVGSLRSVNPYHPFLGIWTTQTRLPRFSREVLHLEQVISREQALRLYTVNNAWLTFEEKEKGSLEAGKLADLLILKADPLTCPEETLRHLEPDETWLGGRPLKIR